MKISYAITVCNELTEIQRLISFLLKHKREHDEIVVLLDKPKASKDLIDYINTTSLSKSVICKESAFQGHFANWKNELTSLCTGDYIFQIDADEYPHELLVEALPSILEANNHVDMFLVPRVNTVEGITKDHITKWRWHVGDNGYVNWPDYQYRIYKNNKIVKWKNKVHEVLEGFNEFACLPQEEYYALYHPKTIDKQEKQNSLYESI